MTVNVYVEGGGDRREQQAQLRRAFAQLFEKTGFKRPNAPAVICSGSRNDAFRDFCNALRQHGNKALLLVDSEGSVDAGAWPHVCRRDGWRRPDNMSDDQIHLMVEMMENWFLADRVMLAQFFGKGFSEKHLPGQSSAVEAASKSSVASGLKMATRTSQKGEYSKGGHSAELLGRLDPDALRRASPHFAALLEALRIRLESKA